MRFLNHMAARAKGAKYTRPSPGCQSGDGWPVLGQNSVDHVPRHSTCGTTLLCIHSPRSTRVWRLCIMIGYVTLGTNDLQRSAAFYDELLGAIGAKRTWDTERFILWSVRRSEERRVG